MKNFFCFSLFVFFFVSLDAQVPSWVWARRAGGYGTPDEGFEVKTDINGNIYVAGSFQSTSITFGTTTLINPDVNGNSHDVFIVKYDPSGNVLWATRAGGSLNDEALGMDIDANSNIYVTGYFRSSSITFGSITLANSSGGYTDAFIVKYDASGNAIWARKGTGSTNDQGIAIRSDASGNTYVSGFFNSTQITFGSTTLTNYSSNGITADIFILKYDSSGNLIWGDGAGGTSNDFPTSISLDIPGGFIYVLGDFSGITITFGSNTATNSTSTGFGMENVLAKYSTGGNNIWVKSYGGSDDELSKNVLADGNGNAYVTGSFRSDTIMIGSIILLNDTNQYTGDYYLAKFDNNGNALWAKSAGGGSYDVGTALGFDSSGDILSTGYFMSRAITFGNITLTNFDTSSSSSDLFILKYDPSGNAMWGISSTSSSIGSEMINSIVTNTDNNILITGDFDSDTLILGNTTLYNAGLSADFLLAELGPPCGISVTQSLIPAGCNFSNGSISVNVVGGTSPYMYSWAPLGGTNAIASGLPAGSYTLQVTDASPCTATFNITLGDSCDYVWPGDANDDGVADNLDILAIGIGFGKNGPVRTGASLNWIGLPCNDWVDTLNNGINYKHVDCDGSGMIDFADTNAVILNYGMIHNNRTESEHSQSAPDLFAQFSSDTVSSGGAVVNVQFGLGTTINPVVNIYGLAFQVSLDNPSLINPSPVSFSGLNSWMGNPGADLIPIGFSQNFPNNEFVAITRIDQQNRSGNGFIAKMSFKTSAILNNSGNQMPLILSFSNITAITNTGQIIPVNSLSDTIVVRDSMLLTGVASFQDRGIAIFPNPGRDRFFVSGMNPNAQFVLQVQDALGRLVYSSVLDKGNNSFNIGAKPAGIYFYRLITTDSTITGKFVIQ